jgi:hypothetical protein
MITSNFRRWGRYALVAATVCAVSVICSSDVSARKWKATKQQQALDYLQIDYHSSDREFIIVQWLAPAMIENNLQTKTIREMLDLYVVVLVAHMKISSLGQVESVSPTGISAETADKKIHQPVAEGDLPPALSGYMHAYKKVMEGGLGPAGKGAVVMAFGKTGAKGCSQGALWIRYAGERFEYKTPVPGCE